VCWTLFTFVITHTLILIVGRSIIGLTKMFLLDDLFDDQVDGLLDSLIFVSAVKKV